MIAPGAPAPGALAHPLGSSAHRALRGGTLYESLLVMNLERSDKKERRRPKVNFRLKKAWYMRRTSKIVNSIVSAYSYPALFACKRSRTARGTSIRRLTHAHVCAHLARTPT